jgi:hypothetical protein
MPPARGKAPTVTDLEIWSGESTATAPVEGSTPRQDRGASSSAICTGKKGK